MTGESDRRTSEASACDSESDEGSPAGATALRTSPDRRVVRTRRAIRRAFLSLMQETDYQKISITAIAREADIDRKTFYLHYDSIESLVDEIIQDEADRIVDACVESLSGRAGTQVVLDLFEQLTIGLAPDMKSTKRIASHIPYELVLKKLEGSLTASLIENDTLGLSAMGPYLNYCVAFFSAGLVTVTRRWILDDSEIPLEDIAEVTHVAVRSGIEGILAMMESAAEGGESGAAAQAQAS